MLNDESKETVTDKVLDAISAIKDKAEDTTAEDSTKDGVNLESIVKKLTKRREKEGK